MHLGEISGPFSGNDDSSLLKTGLFSGKNLSEYTV